MDNSNNNSDPQQLATPVDDIQSPTNADNSTQNLPGADSGQVEAPTTPTPEMTDSTPEPAPTMDSPSTTETPQITPKEEEPLIDLPRPKPAIEATADDGQATQNTDSPAPVPATVSDKAIVGEYLHSKNKPAIIAIASVLILLITAGLAFLYVQNNRLKGQIRTIEDINSQRKLSDITPTASPTAMMMEKDLNVFSNLDTVITKAQAESTTAQLLMVTIDGQTLTDSKGSTYNYWFRTGPSTGEYFQIAKPYAGEYLLIKPASVNPDNNIPDLIQSQKANSLGIDDEQVIKLGWEKVAKQFSQGNDPRQISLIYIIATPSNPTITTPVNLWQVTYYFPPESGVEDVIIQVDANNQNVVYTNKNIAVPTQEVTPTATQSATPAS